MVRTVKACTSTKNQPIQSAIYTDCDYWRSLIQQLADVRKFIIKKGVTLGGHFFDIVNTVNCAHQNSGSTCRNQNVLHGGPERPPVTNPNRIITNINIGK